MADWPTLTKKGRQGKKIGNLFFFLFCEKNFGNQFFFFIYRPTDSTQMARHKSAILKINRPWPYEQMVVMQAVFGEGRWLRHCDWYLSKSNSCMLLWLQKPTDHNHSTQGCPLFCLINIMIRKEHEGLSCCANRQTGIWIDGRYQIYYLPASRSKK